MLETISYKSRNKIGCDLLPRWKHWGLYTVDNGLKIELHITWYMTVKQKTLVYNKTYKLVVICYLWEDELKI